MKFYNDVAAVEDGDGQILIKKAQVCHRLRWAKNVYTQGKVFSK